MKKFPLYTVLLVVLLGLLAGFHRRHLAPIAHAARDNFSGQVVAVSDGDTIGVMKDGREVKVRLYGVDAPEKSQAFDQKAKQFTSDFAFGKTVTVTVKDTDRYGRIVGEVVREDSKVLNQELVRAGFAWWYKQYAKNDRTLEALEKDARENKRGLWADKNPVPPWKFRQAGREEE